MTIPSAVESAAFKTYIPDNNGFSLFSCGCGCKRYVSFSLQKTFDKLTVFEPCGGGFVLELRLQGAKAVFERAGR